MKSTKMLTILVLALGLMVCQAEVSEAEPMGTAFTYQGHLYDANHVANGLYNFAFKLYDADVGGSKAANDVNVADVDVIDGYFTVELDFGSSVFDGNAVWLEIGVRPGEFEDPNVYTMLSPRQEVTPVPYALQTRGIFVDNDGNVGIATTSPAGKLDVHGKIKEYGNDLLPTGVIVMWSGNLASIPPGWALCDGGTYTCPDGTPATTPDLRGRFIYGVSAGEDPGATGGSTTHFHDYFDVPFHNHTITDPGHIHDLRGGEADTSQPTAEDWLRGGDYSP